MYGIAISKVFNGWPQIYSGHDLRGRTFLGLYLATLLCGLLTLGTPTSAMLLGLALAVHISSIIDIVFVGCREWHERAVYTAMFCVVIGLAGYYPAVWLATRVAIPQRIVLDAPPLRAGDVFLYNPSAYGDDGPELGDVVMYDISAAQIGLGGTQYMIRGLRIDRVVALSGQTLSWDGKQLTLDGATAPYTPLNEELSSTKFSMKAPDGHCLILPSTDPTIGGAFSGDVWGPFCRVPHRSVRGKVFLRNQPFSRWWFVR
jgi:hypothetical protein